MLYNKDYNRGFWKIPLLPALSCCLVGLLQTCLAIYHPYSRELIFLLFLWKNDESCVSSLAEHVCRLKITGNRQMVGKSVIPLHICQDLGQGSGFPFFKPVKWDIPPGVLGSAGSAHATQVMSHSWYQLFSLLSKLHSIVKGFSFCIRILYKTILLFNRSCCFLRTHIICYF